MKLNTEGIILSEQTTVNSKRLLTVLTRDNGIIRCFVNDGKESNRIFGAATNILCYSHLSLYVAKNSYNLTEAVSIEFFYNLMFDVRKLALAQYFCELAIHVIPEGTSEPEYLSLILNSLYLLNHNKKPDLLVKAVFELRFLSLAGFMPDVVGCRGCGLYEADEMYFDFASSCLWCKNCCGGTDVEKINKTVLHGLRTSVLAEPKKIFSFTAGAKDIAVLANVAERYTSRITERNYKTLEYYKEVLLDEQHVNYSNPIK